MAKVGVRSMQELVGRTDLLKFIPKSGNAKAKLLDYTAILKNALEMRPGINIVGGSVAQDFQLEKRLVRYYLFELRKSFINICDTSLIYFAMF